MNIHIDPTSNKNIIKFVVENLSIANEIEFDSSEEAADFPLLAELLSFPFVKKVLASLNFVAIEKKDDFEWEPLLDGIKEVISNHLSQNLDALSAKRQIPFTLYAEMTPNPQVMKFVANKLLFDGRIELKSVEETTEVPIAKNIFEKYPFVKEIFISDHYLSLMAEPDYKWDESVMELRSFILEYLREGKTVITENFKPESIPNAYENPTKEFSEIEEKIKAVLEEYVKPAVAGDGGNIELIEFKEENKTAYMLLQGACSGCPSSTATLKNGIQSMLQQFMPGEVENVEAING